MYDSKALVIADKASAHSCDTFEAVRQQWEAANNAVLIHGSTHDKVAIPGGFGAAGAPNDGIHQYFHQLRRCYMKVVVGQGNSVAMRRSLENLNLDIDGNPRFKNIGCNVGYINIYIYDMIYTIYIYLSLYICKIIYICIYIYIHYMCIWAYSNHRPNKSKLRVHGGAFFGTGNHQCVHCSENVDGATPIRRWLRKELWWFLYMGVEPSTFQVVCP